ncbi:hypothetical protein ASF87_04755 [Microbacterium sp. Leaf161]|uniref:hypothetical protein n=1 Tax=Microbacterium sp. Leaf161 TaxID=1736281 RepID=UPI0006F53B37|nr:hypothetical protein [Microbacterium sp. Leaf161]KQR48236.1 hypothetical protein ASF87_04755 [Microbacterium sp. Leaf161]
MKTQQSTIQFSIRDVAIDSPLSFEVAGPLALRFVTTRKGTRLVAEYAATPGSHTLSVAELLGLHPLDGSPAIREMAEIAASSKGMQIVAWLVHEGDSLVVSHDWLVEWRHLVHEIWVEVSDSKQDSGGTDVINMVLRNGHNVVASQEILGNDADRRQAELVDWFANYGERGTRIDATNLDVELIAEWGIAGIVLGRDVLDCLVGIGVDVRVTARK